MKKSFLFVMGATILVSCSQSDLIENQPSVEGISIAATSVHNGTRAPYVGTISESNQLTARVLTSETSGDYTATNLYANGQMIFKGGAITSSYEASTVDAGKNKFPDASGTTYYMCGLYPYENWALSTSASTTANIGLTGKEDVMFASQQQTSATLVAGGTVPALTFSHLLTKLEVKLQATKNPASGKWGKVTKIEVLKAAGADLKNTATVMLGTGATTFTGATAVYPMYGMSVADGKAAYTEVEFASHALTTTATPVAYVMIPSFTATGTDDVTLRVTTEYEGAKSVNVKLNSGATAGYAYGITLTFDVELGVIQSSASVIDWVSGGEAVQPVV